MVTEAEIQSINFNSNSCIVRIPLFETAGTLEPFIAEAKICVQPGIYNGYQPGDTVWVDFINDIKERPLVVGKIFKSSEDEKNNQGSAIVSPSIDVSNHVSIPSTTEITNIPDNYNTIQKIVNNIDNSKLYKHEVILEDKDHYIILYIITGISTNLTANNFNNQNNINNLFLNSVSIKACWHNDEIWTVTYLAFKTGHIEIYLSTNTYNEVSLYLDTLEDVVDNVSPI